MHSFVVFFCFCLPRSTQQSWILCMLRWRLARACVCIMRRHRANCIFVFATRARAIAALPLNQPVYRSLRWRSQARNIKPRHSFRAHARTPCMLYARLFPRSTAAAAVWDGGAFLCITPMSAALRPNPIRGPRSRDNAPSAHEKRNWYSTVHCTHISAGRALVHNRN